MAKRRVTGAPPPPPSLPSGNSSALEDPYDVVDIDDQEDVADEVEATTATTVEDVADEVEATTVASTTAPPVASMVVASPSPPKRPAMEPVVPNKLQVSPEDSQVEQAATQAAPQVIEIIEL